MSKLNNEQLLTAYVSSGFNLTRTAQQLNICRQTVSKRIKSNEFQALLTEYRKTYFSSQVKSFLKTPCEQARHL